MHSLTCCCYLVSAVENWIVLGRWRFDSNRGLRLECKRPQLADTELKELGYAENGSAGITVVLVLFIVLTVCFCATTLDDLPVKRKSVSVAQFSDTVVAVAKKQRNNYLFHFLKLFS